MAFLVDLTGWPPEVIREVDAEEMARIVEFKMVQHVAQFGGEYQVG